jgi:hypothetical protein
LVWLQVPRERSLRKSPLRCKKGFATPLANSLR